MLHSQDAPRDLHEEPRGGEAYRAFIEVVNVREQCSWVHAADPSGATQKAIDLIRGGCREKQELNPPSR
ncbi:hypothetical protein KEJ13_09655 [Candidatus Bathyarchaeota archaeon]|nr:hypothetical protein [Candidatus Bathyarchaeota archaeon]